MKKTFALICTLAMLLTSIPVGAFELETVESSAETVIETTTAAETQAEASLEALAIEPGKNILTGTAGYLTFDGANDTSVFTSYNNFNTMTVVENPTAYDGTTAIDPDGTYGKILCFHRDANPSGHWSGYGMNSVKFDGDRYVWITFDEYWDIESPVEVWACFTNFYMNGAKLDHWNTGIKASEANKWRNFDYVNKPVKDATVYMQTKSSNVKAVNDQSIPTVPTNYYVDNYAFVPFYKITYKGVTETVDQVLFADESKARSFDNLATQYTVKTDNYDAPYGKDGAVYTQIGWATTENATVAVTSVDLANADITLYPVYESRQVLTYALDDLNAEWGKTGTITASEKVTWSYDVDIADVIGEGNRPTVSVSDDGFTATVTGKGMNAYVTVTATTEDGVELTRKILITGAAENLPGANIFTNTPEGLDFDTITVKGTNTMFTEGSYNKLVTNENKSDANSSDKVLKISGGQYPNFWTRWFDSAKYIELERPIYISYDYYGTFTCHWNMINGSGGSDIFKNVYDLGFKASETWTTMTSAKTLSQSTNTANTAVKRLSIEVGQKDGVEIYVDNWKIIPWYKISYIGLDGESVVATDYALCDDDGNILDAYVPKESVARANGGVAVSLTKGGEKVTSVPFANKDLTVYIIDTAPATFIAGDDKVNVTLTAGEDYTIPTLEALEMSDVENFVAWQDSAENLYYPGDVVAAADLESFMGITLRPFCYDLTIPAVIAYEGDVEPSSYDVGNWVYVENIEDEGRSVFHLHQYASTWGKQNNVDQWKRDARVFVRFFEMGGFDAADYTLVAYSYKLANVHDINPNTTPVGEVTEDILTSPTTAQAIIYYYTSTAGNGFYSPGGEHRVGDARQHLTDGKYHIDTIDMSIAKNGNGNAPWKDKIYGFAIDPAKVGWSSDVYLDYLRVYRKGNFTVTYDSNLPDGLGEDDIVYSVPAETNRGLGANYYLTGDRPVLSDDAAEAYVFLGWSLTKDGTTTTEVIPVFDRSTTVYAVWGEINEVPNVDANNIGVRSDTEFTKGVRFTSSISNESRALASEYGFIIARKDVLGDDELTFGFKDHKGNAQYAYGAAYDKDKGIDKQAGTTDDGIVFAAVAVNVPAAHYATKLVARTYMKYDVAGNALTMYGTAATTSLKETAQAVKDAGGTQYEENKTYVDEILAYEAE